MQLSGVGVWSFQLRFGDPGEVAEAAAELEELGYSALWIPDVGGDVLGAVEALLGATTRTVVATGILNAWMHDAGEVAARRASWAEEWRDRFLLGLGISHDALIDRDAPGRWQRPLATMRAYLAALDAAADPVPRDSRVLAALGPRMLELAGDETLGAHPYNVTPGHTAQAREILGPHHLLAPEHAVVLEADPGTARQLARGHLALYLELPNYTNNLRRLGFSEEDLSDGGSDRLIDAVVAWGDAETITAKVGQHYEAGADHVCIQVVTGRGQGLPRAQWRQLAEVLVP